MSNIFERLEEENALAPDREDPHEESESNKEEFDCEVFNSKIETGMSKSFDAKKLYTKGDRSKFPITDEKTKENSLKKVFSDQ